MPDKPLKPDKDGNYAITQEYVDRMVLHHSISHERYMRRIRQREIRRKAGLCQA